jgi:hypothetical protein
MAGRVFHLVLCVSFLAPVSSDDDDIEVGTSVAVLLGLLGIISLFMNGMLGR